MVNASTLIGVVLLARHGDRSSTVYQSPTTYDSVQGYLTPLGASQEYELGQFLRNTYLDPQSSCYIQGINTDIVDVDQLYIRADAGGGDVILDSAYALTQGLYPPTPESTITLANGQVVTSPLGGYQYVPVESLEYWQAPSLTSWMDCQYFQLHLNRVYSNPVFKDLVNTSAPFLQAVEPYLNGMNNSFFNMWNIYDYINVQYTHNKTFYDAFPKTLLEQARYYANIHESYAFSEEAPNGIGQVAIRTLWPEIFWSLGNMTQSNNTVKLALTEVDYKPFISIFNVTNAAVTDPDIAGIVDYASVVAFELSQNIQGQYNVTMKFRNGTSDDEFRTLKMWGSESVSLDKLKENLFWTTINSTVNWCFSCNQTVRRGCSVYNFSNDPYLNPTVIGTAGETS